MFIRDIPHHFTDSVTDTVSVAASHFFLESATLFVRMFEWDAIGEVNMAQYVAKRKQKFRKFF